MTLQFTGPVEGYVVNFLRKNFWRIAGTHEWDDAMQEARLIFLRVQRKYPDAEDKHLMSLFKTAWGHHFTDLSVKDSRGRHIQSESNLARDEDSLPREMVGATDNDGMLAMMIRQAPSEVRMVLSLFLSAPAELLETAARAWSGGPRGKKEGNALINRCLGLPENTESLEAVRDYFTK